MDATRRKLWDSDKGYVDVFVIGALHGAGIGKEQMPNAFTDLMLMEYSTSQEAYEGFLDIVNRYTTKDEGQVG